MDRLRDHGMIESYTLEVLEDGTCNVTFVTPVPVGYIELKVEI